MQRISPLIPGVTSAADMVRTIRTARGLSQRELARLSGVSVSRISAYELGSRVPSIDGLNKVLGGLELRTVLTTEPVNAALDRHIDEVASLSMQQRLSRVNGNVFGVLSFLVDAQPILGGPIAALLHGVPMPVDYTTLLIAADKIDRVAAQFARMPPARWCESVERFLTGEECDPRVEGAMRWRSWWGELRIEFCEDLPPAVSIRVPSDTPEVDDRVLEVVTIDRIGALDAEQARLVDRVIERSRARLAGSD